ncbi:MAG: PilN domain-containing protein [Candidatus Moranbacteria bacterium]|nr:PilN domain-containing protein [Candidatus Moranbacteria bacterium]
MKIAINLLPEKRKKDIKRRKFLLFIIWQEVLIIFTAIVFFAVLFSTNFILGINFQNIQKDGEKYFNRSEFKEMKKYEQEFANVNKRASVVREIQKNDFYWTNFFYELSRIIPEGIKLSSLSTNQSSVTLMGRSNSRDNLIVLKDKLEASGCFLEVDVPLSNIVKKEDIDFKIELKINKECLKTKE